MVLNGTSLSVCLSVCLSLCVCVYVSEDGSAAVQKGCWMDGFFLDGGWEEGIKE